MKIKHTLLTLFSLVALISFAQSWTSLGIGLNDKGRVLLNDSVNNRLIVGGDFTYAGGQSALFIASWDGVNWQNIGMGFNAPVYALAIYNNELYAGGAFTLSGTDTVKYIAKWNGIKWVSVGQQTPNNKVNFLKTFQGKLYISGDFTTYGNINKRNVTWNGTTLDSISGFPYKAPINDIAFYKFKTYFACNGNLLSYNGFTFKAIYSSGANTGSIYIKSLEIHQNLLYTAGYNSSSSSQYSVDAYDGASFQGYYLFNAVYPTDGPVNAIKSIGNNLYMGGTFDHAAYGVNTNFVVNNITRFDSNNQKFYSVNYGTDAEIKDIEVFNNTLYIVGDFVYAGTSTSNFIAKLSSVSSIKNVASKYNISTYPNPNNGQFTIQTNNLPEGSNLEIMSMVGERIFSKNNIDNTTNVDISTFAKGIYFYNITTPTQEKVQGKIVVK